MNQRAFVLAIGGRGQEKTKMKKLQQLHSMAAYGGPGWQPRRTSLRQELGTVWGSCGIASEWQPLKAVLMHRPGPELSRPADPDAAQMLQPLDWQRARSQHDALAQAYRQSGVTVHYLEPETEPAPNQMFMADLLFATPEGVVLCRPASQVRAGEERHVAAAMARLGIPVIRTISGRGTFEGADAMWIASNKVIIGRGLRTNDEGIAQLTSVLDQMGVETIVVDMPYGTMHLMGMLRIVDRDLAVAWPTRLAYAAVRALEAEDIKVVFLPDQKEAVEGFALNFVTIGPRTIIMPEGNPNCQSFYQQHGIRCITVQVDELAKAAGAVGCLTGILERQAT